MQHIQEITEDKVLLEQNKLSNDCLVQMKQNLCDYLVNYQAVFLLLDLTDLQQLPSFCIRCHHDWVINECQTCNFTKYHAALIQFRKMIGYYTTFGTTYTSDEIKLKLVDFNHATEFKIANFKFEDFDTIYELLSIVPSPLKKTIITYLKMQIEDGY